MIADSMGECPCGYRRLSSGYRFLEKEINPRISNRGVEICENGNWQRPKLICIKGLRDLISGSKITVFWF
ncbi:Hypothetical protein GALLO_1671 [Streptococcus gallolyticus UCN34]|uniref:Uncharacterized protein n=1 Tax=Streptococcus gallolyticus (strain UCN34) TaxID=637909 RepID=A0AA36JZX1_STRG3|nr:Hypothetical protein GALLO_1671 [Streptococcus gallolyticus UCN34]